MKNIIYSSLQAFTLICLCTAGAGAQEGQGQYPLSGGKTLKFETHPIPTLIPTRVEPPRSVPTPDEVADRKVFWLHGHGGGVGSWDRAAAATQNIQSPPPVSGYPPRKITSYKMDYSGSHNAVSAAASDVKTQIETITDNQPLAQKARNTIVAHSMGGLVSQYMDYLYDAESDENRSFYGLVTVGTPNQGAKLSKNAYPYSGSKAQQFANDACNALKDGPIVEEIETNFWLDLFLNGNTIAKKASEFCNVLTDDVVTLLAKGFNTPIAADLHPNSPVVGVLQAHSPEVTRRVAFYGVLGNTDMIWKTYHYMKNSPNGDPIFGADSSHISVNKMNANKAKYQAKVQFWSFWTAYWQDLYDNCWWQPWNCFQFKHNRNEARKIRDAWQRGLNWWNGANDKWRVLMGDLDLLPNAQGTCYCTETNVSTGVTTGPIQTLGWYNNCSSGFQNGIALSCNYQTTLTLQDVDSDGIVTAASAIALPGAVKTVLLSGDSHFQLVNSPRTGVALFDLWEGTHHPFFKTDKRYP